ncbi:MAG TPA: glycosyltransferase [Gemmataceae bacterium]|jgi:glycosyltransferase involved in cell wall biosynthesis|nr:glycosyltransferase [Gemmataceae bacterium]
MHVLFYHQNYPAQFGHVAARLARSHGYRVTFASREGPAEVPGIGRVLYAPKGGATEKTHYCGRTFENQVWHSHALFEALKAHPDIRPDLVVGHSGFGSTLFLRELYPAAKFVNYFEYFYHTTGSDLDFRPEFPPAEIDRLRARARNAGLLLDLDHCDAGYSPTVWQRDRLPAAYRPKVRVVFDGVDTDVWKPGPKTPRQAGRYVFPDGLKLVTYVSRGLEAMRGFDVFMKVAGELCRRRRDVRFVVVGADRTCYGSDEKHTGSKSFKEWVLKHGDYDLSRFAFLGTVPPATLARLLQLSDLHVYLTAPFVLSWSLFDALACGAVVLASDTAPVRELITDEVNGLLCDFFDVAGMADKAQAVLDRPDEFRPLTEAGVALIRERYSLDVCLPQMVRLYEQVMEAPRGPVTE